MIAEVVTTEMVTTKEMTIGVENESNQAKIVIQRQESKQAILIMNRIKASFSKK